MAFGTGLLAFDEMCKRVEAMALRTEDETKTVYLESQVACTYAWCVLHAEPYYRRP